MSQYMDLTSQSAHMVIDEMVAVNKRRLAYAQSVWDILTQPLPANAEGIVRSGVERVDALTKLTAGEFETTLSESGDFAQKLVAQGTALQEASFSSFKEYAEKSYDRLKDVTSSGIESVKSLIDSAQDSARAAA